MNDYYNTDDPVPTTNDPIKLPNANKYDITSAKSKVNYVLQDGDTYHSWPVAYLANNWKSDIDNNGKITSASNTNTNTNTIDTIDIIK